MKYLIGLLPRAALILPYVHRTSRLMTLLLASLFIWFSSGVAPAVASAPETCIPIGTGGAYSGSSGGAPKFADATPYSFNTCTDDNFNRFNKWIDDPRWDGATSTTHGPGTTEIMQYRAVQRTVGGQNYLFLSWWVKNTANSGSTASNKLYVGFRPDDMTSPGIVLKVILGQGNSSVGESAVQGAAETTLYVLSSEVLPTTPNSIFHGTSGQTPLPSWAQDTRVWINQSRSTPGASNCAVGPNVVWAVHMRVPLQTNISPDSNHMVTLSGNFRHWYSAQLDMTTGVAPLTWPRTTSTENYDIRYPSPDFLESTPLFSVWPKFYLSTGNTDNANSCVAGGITIDASDITVSYPNSSDDWHIGIPQTPSSAQPKNTFHAKPINMSGNSINRGDLHARFNMANWGSQMQDGEAVPGTGDWIDIAGLADVVDSTPTISVANGGRWDISKDKQFTYQEFVGKSQHQCVRVELFGSGNSGLSFLKSSAFRNMRTVRLSTLREDAEINLTGLQIGSARDVYLYVEPHNMPAAYFRGPLSASTTRKVTTGPTRDKTPTEVADASLRVPEYESRAATEPTYIVRAFYDTGRKIRENGQDRIVLQPMTSFGYFADHSGDLAGWRHELEGAEKIAENWYRIHVDGKAKITNTLEAVEPRRFGIGLNAGAAIPHGSFGNAYDRDLSFGVDLEYRLDNAYSLVAAAARDKFNPKASDPKLDVTRIAFGARRYLSDGATRPFVAVNAGSYSFSPGRTRSGVSTEIGIQYNLDPQLALEAAYSFNVVSSNGPNSDYSILNFGMRYRF